MIQVVGALGAAGLAAYKWLERYRPTNHGPNPWQPEALFNLLQVVTHIERARELVDGKINSAYRSPSINERIGGAKSSRHMQGLAVDLSSPLGHEEAARKLWSATLRGELGRVHKVIDEPGWVHISWKAPGEKDAQPQLLKMRAGKFERIA